MSQCTRDDPQSDIMQELPENTMEEVTDTIQLAQARRQREQFDRNSASLQANIPLV